MGEKINKKEPKNEKSNIICVGLDQWDEGVGFNVVATICCFVCFVFVCLFVCCFFFFLVIICWNKCSCHLGKIHFLFCLGAFFVGLARIFWERQ